MIKKFLMLPIVLGFMIFSSPSLMAATAMQEMVGIMLSLQHYPNDSQKETLQKIANDSSVSENQRTIATALISMHHTVTDADKEKLENIANNNAAPEAERKVAGILANMHHHASAADKAELEKLK
jgi:hypothetical protein